VDVSEWMYIYLQLQISYFVNFAKLDGPFSLSKFAAHIAHTIFFILLAKHVGGIRACNNATFEQLMIAWLEPLLSTLSSSEFIISSTDPPGYQNSLSY